MVVQCDDLGYASGRDGAILRAAAGCGGVVTAVCVLANGSSARTGVARARAAGLGVGLHVNLTEGAPLCGARVRSLLDGASGMMRGKAGFRAALAAGAIDMAEVEAEAAAQLAWLDRALGAPTRFFNGHQVGVAGRMCVCVCVCVCWGGRGGAVVHCPMHLHIAHAILCAAVIE